MGGPSIVIVDVDKRMVFVCEPVAKPMGREHQRSSNAQSHSKVDNVDRWSSTRMSAVPILLARLNLSPWGTSIPQDRASVCVGPLPQEDTDCCDKDILLDSLETVRKLCFVPIENSPHHICACWAPATISIDRLETLTSDRRTSRRYCSRIHGLPERAMRSRISL